MAKKKLTIKQAWGKTTYLIRKHLKTYIAVGLVAVAVDLIIMLGFENAIGGAYRRLWFVLVFSAYIWLTKQLEKGKEAPKAKQVFYEGSAPFVKMILVILVLILYLIPLAVGASVYGFIQQPQFGASTAELVLGQVVWGLFAVVSFYWLLRAVYAPFIVFSESPIKSVRESFKLTKPSKRRLLGHLSIIWVLILLTVGLMAYLLGLVEPDARQLVTVLQAVAYLLFMPFYVTYIRVLLNEA